MKTWQIIAAAAGTFAVVFAATGESPDHNARAQSKLWVTADNLPRHTCPSESCGMVGNLIFRESATVLESQDGWGRISDYYYASCVNGRSEYVDAGPDACEASNGIRDGRLAEWVRLEFLSEQEPPDPAAGATGTAKLVGQSDDFRRHETAFVLAADALMASGECTASDFTDMGGWVKSTSHGAGVYFMWCGGGSDRIYLDVSSGRTFR